MIIVAKLKAQEGKEADLEEELRGTFLTCQLELKDFFHEFKMAIK